MIDLCWLLTRDSRNRRSLVVQVLEQDTKSRTVRMEYLSSGGGSVYNEIKLINKERFDWGFHVHPEMRYFYLTNKLCEILNNKKTQSKSANPRQIRFHCP